MSALSSPSIHHRLQAGIAEIDDRQALVRERQLARSDRPRSAGHDRWGHDALERSRRHPAPPGRLAKTRPAGRRIFHTSRRAPVRHQSCSNFADHTAWSNARARLAAPSRKRDQSAGSSCKEVIAATKAGTSSGSIRMPQVSSTISGMASQRVLITGKPCANASAMTPG